MKPKTYFKLDNKRQLEQIYDTQAHKFHNSKSQLFDLFDKGSSFLLCNEFDVISLNSAVTTNFYKEIPNPITGKMSVNENTDIKKTIDKHKDLPSEPLEFDGISEQPEKQQEKLPYKNSRRERIDIILNTINVKVDADLLTKLIEVFDLESTFEDKMQLSQILELRNK